MTNNKIKAILSVSIIIFSLFMFANLVINTTFFDTNSEKNLDLENDTKQENDKKEKKEFILFNTFSCYRLFTCKQKSTYNLYLHNYHNTSSLFKPPILHS